MGAPPEILSTTFASLSQVKLLRSARSMRDIFLCNSPHLRAGQCVQLVATERRRAAQREAARVERGKASVWLRSSRRSSAAAAAGPARAGRAKQECCVKRPKQEEIARSAGKADYKGVEAAGNSAEPAARSSRAQRRVAHPAKLIHGYGRASTYPRCSSRFRRGQQPL